MVITEDCEGGRGGRGGYYSHHHFHHRYDHFYFNYVLFFYPGCSTRLLLSRKQKVNGKALFS